MFKFYEIQDKTELTSNITQLVVKIVTTEEAPVKNAFLVTAKYFLENKKVKISEDALIWSDETKDYVETHLEEALKILMELYLENEFRESPREWTTSEIREKLLVHIWHMVDYWHNQEFSHGLNGKTTPIPYRERMQGLAFSILTALDGCAGDLPGFIVAPYPHESDKEFHIENGENFYPYNSADAIKGDIGGSLHDHFYPVGRKFGYEKE